MRKRNIHVTIGGTQGCHLLPERKLRSVRMPSVGGVYADPNPPGNHQQREELRRDQQRLEQLRQRRNQERREGDRDDAREYNEKMRDQKREIRQDRRGIVTTGGVNVIASMITIVSSSNLPFEVPKGFWKESLKNQKKG